MAGDDIDKLLRELDALEGAGTSARAPASRGKDEVAQPSQAQAQAAKGGKEPKGKAKSGRFAFAVVAAIVSGIVGAGVGMVLGPVLGWLPLLDFGFWATGLGAALGGFLTGIVAGPPRWFSD